MKIQRIIASDIIATAFFAALKIYIYWFAYKYFLNQYIIMVVGFAQLSGMFLSILGGGISDMINKLLFIKTLKFLKVLLLIAFFLLYGVLQMEILLPLLMLLSTIIGNLLSPTLESLIPSLAKNNDNLYQLNAIVASLTQVANIAAVLISAIFISFFSFISVIFISLLFSLLSYVLLIGIRIETTIHSNSVINNINQGVRYIFSTIYIRNLIPFALIINFSFWSIFLLLPKVSIDNFSFLKTSYSMLELAFALGGVFGGWLFSKYLFDYKNKYDIFKYTLILQSSVLLLLGINLIIFNGVIAYIFMLILWFGYATINTIFSIIYFGSLQIKIPKEIIGSVFGAILTIFSLTNPLAAIASGFLTFILPIPILIIIFAIMMLLSALIIRWIPSIKKAFE